MRASTPTAHEGKETYAEDADTNVFGYFRDDENESCSGSSIFLCLGDFGSFLKQWWTESLWPGMGLFGESYLLFSIGTLTPLWKEIYPDCWDHDYTDDDDQIDSVYSFAYELYGSGNTAAANTAIASCSPRLLESLTYGVVLGVIAGMILLGYWSNHIGRRKGSILTASFMAGGSLGLVALSVFGATQWSAESIFRGTVACLVLFGIGVGGEYPLSASLASEKATEELAKNQSLLIQREELYKRQQEQQQQQQASGSTARNGMDEEPFSPENPPQSALLQSEPTSPLNHRGRRVQLVFAMQGMGIWFNSLTMLVLLWALTGQSNNNNNYGNGDGDGRVEYDASDLVTVWRVTYGIGTLVLCFVLLTRILYLEESKVWLDANRSNTSNGSPCVQEQEQQNQTKLDRFKLVHRQYGSRMFGAGMAWLLWDISFYGNKLFQSTFLLALVGDQASLVELTGAAALNATVALLGYYGAALLIDLPPNHRHGLGGRKGLQSMGLVTTGSLFFACGWLASSSSSSSTTTVALYLVSSFVGQLGPNCTTFLIPAEIVPTDQRTYCHGVCAAAGKIGALIAAVIFHFVGNTQNGSQALFYLCGIAGVLGAVVTHFFVPETAGLDLLELDLQWKLLLGGREGADKVCYDGPAVHKDHLSLYEQYCLGRSGFFGKPRGNERGSDTPEGYWS